MGYIFVKVLQRSKTNRVCVRVCVCMCVCMCVCVCRHKQTQVQVDKYIYFKKLPHVLWELASLESVGPASMLEIQLRSDVAFLSLKSASWAG